MMWLASWLKSGNRYTLEQMRANLPESMRRDLEYRDAIAIAFFAAYMLPQMQGLLLGFGSGNIFRRLNREAPMGAIRRSLRDTMEARAHGLRASGLEDHFADLMREAGVLDATTGLEAVHGAEPLHLYTSTYSGCYFFAWDATMTFGPVLKSLRIEGNLNRFAAVSAWLERNARLGLQPTEDTVTRAQAAQIDMALLHDPALIALHNADGDDIDIDPLHDDGIAAVVQLVEEARSLAVEIGAKPPRPRADRPRTRAGVRADGRRRIGMGVPADHVAAAAPAAPAVPVRRGDPLEPRRGQRGHRVHDRRRLDDAGKPV